MPPIVMTSCLPRAYRMATEFLGDRHLHVVAHAVRPIVMYRAACGGPSRRAARVDADEVRQPVAHLVHDVVVM